MRLVYLSLAWILGIYLGAKVHLPWALVAIPFGLCFLWIVFFRQHRLLLWFGLCLLLLVGGMARYHAVSEGDALQAYRGFYELRGVVAADPDIRDYATSLRLDVCQLKVDGEWRDISGTVLAEVSRFPELGTSRDFPYYRYGDLLEIKGILESPKDLEEFDFKEYLARQGIYSVLTRTSAVTLIDASQKSKPMEWIYRLRNNMSASMDKALPEPQGSLSKAILLGERGAIPQKVKDDFSRTGTTHLLAISGSNVSIVAGMVLAAAIWAFGRRRPTYFLLALAVVWIYAVLAGMSPPVVRAAFMGSLWLYADWLGRPKSAIAALVLVAAVMLAIDPRLLENVSFQLSFAAMAGLVLIAPVFQNWGRRKWGDAEQQVSGIKEFLITSCAVTLGAVLATFPLIAYYFGVISVMSLPATLFALPALPGIMGGAALVGFVGMVSSAGANAIGWVTWLLVTYMLKVVELFAAIPLASIDFKVNALTAGICYGVLGTVFWLPQRKSRLLETIRRAKGLLMKSPGAVIKIPHKWAIISLVIAVALVWSAFFTVSDSRLHIYILDVGQGDAIMISKGHRQVLIDGGPSAAALNEELGGRMPFWDRTIELLVLTHPDSDHLTGLVEVLRRYKVEKILTNGQEVSSDVYREAAKLIEEKGVEHIIAQAGQEITIGVGIRMAVLNPRATPVGGVEVDENDNSVVLRLEQGNFSMLLTGDIGQEAEKALLGTDATLRSTILKVAHHGSNTCTGPEFLAEVKPMLAVISVGAQNKFGHPTAEVVSRLEQAVGADRLLLTSQEGRIELVTDGNKLWAKTER